MRENRLYGSEGGEAQFNESSLSLSSCRAFSSEKLGNYSLPHRACKSFMK